ncbi:MAG: MlaD family protein [bacterium]
MEFKANEIKAGLMIFLSLCFLILFLVVIFGIDIGEKTKEYQIYFKYIGGISKGSLVKYGGMDVGYVSEITLPNSNESKIAIKIQIDEKTPVRVDSKAFITSVGIMADQHIEITTGTLGADLLPPGIVIDSKEVLSFSQMAEPLSELNTQLQELITRVVDIFNEENRTHFTSIMENMDNLLVDGQKHFSKLVTNLEELSGQLAKLSKDLNELMVKNKGNFDLTLAHLKSTTEETSQLISELRTTLSNFQSILMTNNNNFNEIMENFQFASQNLEEFTRMVKERPWLLVRKAAPPERKLP